MTNGHRANDTYSYDATAGGNVGIGWLTGETVQHRVPVRHPFVWGTTSSPSTTAAFLYDRQASAWPSR
jgi:hypothetical protein